MAKDRIHVTRSDDGWRVAREGAARASAVSSPRKPRPFAGRAPSRTTRPAAARSVIHGRDGRIINSNTINRSDLNPPRDTKQ